MKIIYANIEQFKKKYNKDILNQYADREFKTEKRFFEYTIGRYLVKKTAAEFFNTENPEIITDKKGKPFFKNSNLHFSISHSKEIIIACIDSEPCGIDIEYIKPRDLAKLSNYFKQDFQTLDDFYKFWTLKEATYKLNDKVKNTYSDKFLENYYLTITSASDIKIEISEFDK